MMGADHPDWNGDASSAQPAEQSTFTAEELASVAPPPADDDGDEDFDEIDRKLIASGAFTKERLAELYGKPADKIAPEKPKPPTRADIDAELEKIAQLRRNDSAAYFKDNAAQKRELLLLEEKQRLEGEAKLAATLTPAADELAKIDAELADIDKLRRDDRRAYLRDPAIQAKERDLLEAKEALTLAAEAHERGSSIVDAVLADIPEAEHQAFNDAFDAMPEAVHDVIRDHLGAAPFEPGRPASEADIQRFAGSDIGGDLVKDWGRQAGAKLALVRSRLETMMMKPGMEQALDWFEGLPPAQARAVMKALSR